LSQRATRLQISIAGGDTAQSRNLQKRVALVERLAAGLASKRVLDCGCGAGAYTRAYARLGAHAIGVEYNLDKLRQARSSEPAPTFLRADVGRLPLRDCCIDVVVFNEVLEHVPDEHTALVEATRVLAPDGVLIVLSPNRLYPFETHGVSLKHLGTKLPAHTPLIPYVPLPIGLHVFDYWARNYWPWQLRQQLRAAGLTIHHTSFITQTLENISGTQPRLLAAAAPALRVVLAQLERVPGINAFVSVSQVIAAHPAR
jgi:ubiquinone/menaquinone biosynthesis C-methylase UbiE